MPNHLTSHIGANLNPQGPVFPSPHDWRDQFIYFLFLDRFNDGAAGTPAYVPGTTPTGRDDWKGDQWQGGTIDGITDKLDYIKNLGCTAIWVTPPFKGDGSYHGYGIQNFFDIDPNFGSINAIQRLTKEAHQRNMYVILDIIINHTGDNWAYPGGYRYYYSNGDRFSFGSLRDRDGVSGIQFPNDGVWPIEFQKTDWYKRKGEIGDWNNLEEARNGDFGGLKELDTENRETLKGLIDVYKYWIAIADIDGYRLDTVKHVKESSTSIFCSGIKEYARKIGKKNFFIFGEIVGDDGFINAYIGRNAHIEGTNERFPGLDAALDFPLWGTLEWVIKGFQNPSKLRDRYENIKNTHSDYGHAAQFFVTFLDNHDQIGRDPKGRFLHNNPNKEQLTLGIGYLLTSMGVPCIYYGTEQGFDGGGNHDKYLRDCMFGGEWGAFDTKGHHFFNKNNPIYKKIAQIAGIRQKEPALRYGRQYFREISGNSVNFGHPIDNNCTLAYSRILDDTEILVAMNLNSNNPRNDYITVDGSLTHQGKNMVNLLKPGSGPVHVNKTAEGRCYVNLPLDTNELAILKLA
jgi:glycosidase